MQLIVKTEGTIESFKIDRDAKDIRNLDRFRIGEALVEVMKVAEEKVFCRVLEHGTTRKTDKVEYITRPLSVAIIVLSDRAAAGEYEDKSGVLAAKMLTDFLQYHKWAPKISTKILPDDTDEFRQQLNHEIEAETDIVFTIGSTGLGPRDIAPEVVIDVGDKIIPGVMENIRVKYGATIPNALLSRSVAVVAKTTQIYAVPGSVKAVAEYLGEIFKTIEHATYMIHGFDH